ncbi:hypothetical protein C8J57DRAFT_1241308 [Mycena rebaudengoi]|nr:hypothetical protein C8J57DRAFT_1241308 [Mycena rebaudengoi]
MCAAVDRECGWKTWANEYRAERGATQRKTQGVHHTHALTAELLKRGECEGERASIQWPTDKEMTTSAGAIRQRWFISGGKGMFDEGADRSDERRRTKEICSAVHGRARAEGMQRADARASSKQRARSVGSLLVAEQFERKNKTGWAHRTDPRAAGIRTYRGKWERRVRTQSGHRRPRAQSDFAPGVRSLRVDEVNPDRIPGGVGIAERARADVRERGEVKHTNTVAPARSKAAVSARLISVSTNAERRPGGDGGGEARARGWGILAPREVGAGVGVLDAAGGGARICRFWDGGISRTWKAGSWEGGDTASVCLVGSARSNETEKEMTYFSDAPTRRKKAAPGAGVRDMEEKEEVRQAHQIHPIGSLTPCAVQHFRERAYDPQNGWRAVSALVIQSAWARNGVEEREKVRERAHSRRQTGRMKERRLGEWQARVRSPRRRRPQGRCTRERLRTQVLRHDEAAASGESVRNESGLTARWSARPERQKKG